MNGLNSMDLHEIILPYLVIINIASAIIYGWDKLCAIQHWRRVPEITLLGIAIIGGSIGALLDAKAALNTFIVVVSNIGFNCMY